MPSFPNQPPPDPARVSGATLRTLFNIFRDWRLDYTHAQCLLGVHSATYSHWQQDPDSARLETDTLERASYLLGIYKAMQILLPDPSAADTWIHRSNYELPLHRFARSFLACYVGLNHVTPLSLLTLSRKDFGEDQRGKWELIHPQYSTHSPSSPSR